MFIVLKNYFATIRKHRSVTLLNFLGLAAAYVAFMMILMQVTFEFGYDDFRPASDRIYRVETQRSDGKYASYASRNDGARFAALSSSVEASGLISNTMSFSSMRIKKGGQNDATVYRYPFSYVTDSFPATLQMEIVEGVPDLNDRSQVLIPQSMAHVMFDKSGAVGKVIEVVDESRTLDNRREFYVAGVYKDMPANSILKNAVFAGEGDWEMNRLGNRNHTIYMRLDSPDSKEQVERLINEAGISGNIGEKMPHLRLTRMSDIYFTRDYQASEFQKTGRPSGNRNKTLMFLGIAFLVLGIAMINYFNFSVAQAPLRVGSINMQKILGSTLAVLRGGMLFESVLFSIMAYLLALLGLYGLEASSLMGDFQADMTLAGNTGILLAGSGIAVAVGLLVGLYPAFYTTSVPAAITLKGSFGLSFSGRRVRILLIGFQYIISIGLIFLAVFMNLQYRLLCRQDLGFDREQVVALPLSNQLLKQRATLTSILEQNPSVSGVSYAGEDFFGPTVGEHWGFGEKSHVNPEENIELDIRYAAKEFIPMMGMKMVDGRNFTDADELKGRRDQGYPGIINRKAQQVYGLKVGERLGNIEIVGVMEDFNYRSLHTDVEPLMLVGFGGLRNWRQAWGTVYVKVRTENYPAMLSFLRAAAGNLDPNNDGEPYFLDSHMEELYRADAQNTVLITFFSFLAILISLSGVFSLISFETYFRRKEIGVRRVFGASVREVLELFNRTYFRLVAVCFVLVAPLAWYGIQLWLQSYTVQVPMYWWVFVSVFFGVVLLTVATVTWLSYRVATDNPVRSLKSN